MFTRSSLALVLALGVTGCATSSYRPADSPRLSQVLDEGIKYRKNGVTYDSLVEAVANNPRALEEARTSRSLDRWGGGLVLGGIALDVAAAPMVIVGANEQDAALTRAGFGLLVGAFVVEVVGIVVSSHSVPHRLDAINIYNDDVEAKTRVTHSAPAPTGPPATPPADSR